ncbi:hypothetical protein H2198_002599 [Neophaeococcomyces mojaviensis]|uniref:Uncharacterized protein n=1 Tax=Neophaeococcomyces mojaviensis TaxID=3383035 RepID=A0ACC3AE25_9EURO|nr:hypothetical protein H2198_002599 [Knufia sp. JES_112]
MSGLDHSHSNIHNLNRNVQGTINSASSAIATESAPSDDSLSSFAAAALGNSPSNTNHSPILTQTARYDAEFARLASIVRSDRLLYEWLRNDDPWLARYGKQFFAYMIANDRLQVMKLGNETMKRWREDVDGVWEGYEGLREELVRAVRERNEGLIEVLSKTFDEIKGGSRAQEQQLTVWMEVD